MNTRKIGYRILWGVCVGILAACADERVSRELSESAGIAFSGTVRQSISARASEGEEESTNDPISSENDYGEIHIHAFVEGAADDFRSDGIYVTSTDGTSGILKAKEDGDKLAWWDTKADHYFHAWTTPVGVEMPEGSVTEGTVNFVPVNEDLADHTGINKKNNIALEKFIAVQEGPVAYQTNGSDVELVFRHLVSKITVTGVERTGRDNGRDWLDPVKITFPDMPRVATFRTGVDGEEHTGQPRVTIAEEGEKGLSFNAVSRIKDGEDARYPFYLPPFDFETYGEFVVEGWLWHDPTEGKGGYMEYCGPYYGHLKNIQGLAELKAGEHISLYLRVKDGQVFGFATTILGWKEVPEKTSGQSPKHKGIYNADDLRRLYDYCMGHTADISIENLFSEEIDEQGNKIKVIRLYSDIDLESYNVWMGYFNLPDDFVFDGMGHNIKSYPGATPFFSEGKENIKNLYMDGKPYE